MPSSHRPAALLLAAVALVAGAVPLPAAENEQAILAIVNDEPISAYDVNQRMRLMRLQSGVDPEAAAKFNAEVKKRNSTARDRFIKFVIEQDPTLQTRKPSESEIKALQKKFVERERSQILAMREKIVDGSSAGMKDRALADLVGDRLKLQEARKLDLLIEEQEVASALADVAKRNDQSVEQFTAGLASQGVHVSTLRDSIRVKLAWNRVLTRRFRSQAAAGQTEIDSIVSSVPAAGLEATAVELQLQRISIPQTGKLDQAMMARRYGAAEELSQQARGCSNLQQLARSIEGAKFENLGRVKSDALPEQARPILANAKAGDVTPPLFTAAGIEVYAVCARDEKAAVEGARTAAREKIESDKLTALSKGLLSDLCSVAYIDYRNGARPTKQCGVD